MLMSEGKAEKHSNVTAGGRYCFTREESLLKDWTLQVSARVHTLRLRKLDTFDLVKSLNTVGALK